VGSGTASNGSAISAAVASGTSGLASANANSGAATSRNYAGTVTSAVVSGSVAGNVIATSRSEASTSIAGAVDDRARADGLQAAAFATLLPDAADAAAVMAGNVNVEAAMLDKQALATGLLGGRFSENGTATTGQLFSSSADFNIDMTDKTNTSLIVGMLDPLVTGVHGFDSLRVRLNIEGTLVSDLTFADLGTAQTYLDDNVLDFGFWGDLVGTDNVLDIALFLDITEQHVGEGFSTNFIVGAGSPVPVPAAVWLFGSGLFGLLATARRRR